MCQVRKDLDAERGEQRVKTERERQEAADRHRFAFWTPQFDSAGSSDHSLAKDERPLETDYYDVRPFLPGLVRCRR